MVDFQCTRIKAPTQKGAVKVFRAERAQAHETAVFRQIKVYRHLAKQTHQIGYENIVHIIESAPALIILELEDHSVVEATFEDPAQWKHVLHDTARGLVFLHDVGVIHGDMKPDNLLLKATGPNPHDFVCKITDMGGARFDDPTEKAPSYVTFGTTSDMPPELLQEIYLPGGGPFRKKRFISSTLTVTKPGDIWAFGCIIYM
ncbi:hypothetical protein RQP46_011122 [Phenoliferia psychrophenolica]